MSDSENGIKESPHFTFFWTIENMCVPCWVISPIFTVKEMEMTKWYLGIGETYDLKYIRLEISRDGKDDGLKSIEIKSELSLLSKDGLPLMKEVKVGEFNSFKFDYHEIFFLRRVEFLPKDTLTIRCRMWRTGTEIMRSDFCFARTRLRPRRYSSVWTIREFSSLQRDHVRKILLKIDSRNYLTFKLFVTEKDGEEYISIATLEANNYFEDIEISLLDFEGKVVHSEESYKFDNFFKKNRLMDAKESLLPNDIMYLRCEVELGADIVWNVIENYRYQNSTSSEVNDTDTGDIIICEDEATNLNFSLTESLKTLLEESTLSDVILQAGTESFPAHKCILSARSPVFKAMFTDDMKEKNSKTVEIPDIDKDTLRQILSYVYTNTVGKLQWRGAVDLYRAADKYELLDLKKMCSTTLKADLSSRNVCAILSVADLHYDRKLREAAEDFIMHQTTDFFKSDTWKSFKAENAVLVVDILERMLCIVMEKNCKLSYVGY